MVLKEKHEYKSWDNWDKKYKTRNKQALDEFYKENKHEVQAHMFMQFLYA